MKRAPQLILGFAISIIVVAGLLLGSRYIVSPVGKLSLKDLRHDPYLVATPVPVKIEVRTRPSRMQVSYVIGWETKNSNQRKRYYVDDRKGAATGLTPLTLSLVDKGYSHMRVEFRRGDNLFTREYNAIPTKIDEDFSHEMRYPRLQRESTAAPPAPTAK